jgi:hypothetical protein
MIDENQALSFPVAAEPLDCEPSLDLDGRN